MRGQKTVLSQQTPVVEYTAISYVHVYVLKTGLPVYSMYVRMY